MGLKRTHTPCFAAAASVAEIGPVRVRRFGLAARAQGGPPDKARRQPVAPGEILDKAKSARHSLPPNAPA